jgi:hypothetical protein
MRTCGYQNLLGVPGEGIHKPRVLGFAAVDTAATVFAACLLAWFLTQEKVRRVLPSAWPRSFGPNLLICLIGLLIVAELLHAAFCVNTAFLNRIGVSFPQQGTPAAGGRSVPSEPARMPF